MIAPDEVKDAIKQALGNAEVELMDRTGESNHFLCKVKSTAFEGKTPMDRHRMVYSAVKPLMADGRLHAIEIKGTDV